MLCSPARVSGIAPVSGVRVLRSVRAGDNCGVLKTEAAAYMSKLSEEDHAAALDGARTFRTAHPAGSPGASAAFSRLDKPAELAVRYFDCRYGGPQRSHTTHSRTHALPARTAAQTHKCTRAHPPPPAAPTVRRSRLWTVPASRVTGVLPRNAPR